MNKSGMAALLLIGAVAISLLVGVGLLLSSPPRMVVSALTPSDVYLSQDTIDKTIEMVSAREEWCCGIAEVRVGNLAPGVTLHGGIVVHNGNSDEGDSSFALVPNCELLSVSTPEFTLKPMETRFVPITFHMTENQLDRGEYEFLVHLTKSQKTMVQIAYNQKWIVDVK